MGRTGPRVRSGLSLGEPRKPVATLCHRHSWRSGITVSIVSGPSWVSPTLQDLGVTDLETQFPAVKKSLYWNWKNLFHWDFPGWTWCLKTWHLLQIWWKGLEKMLILCLCRGSAEALGPPHTYLPWWKKKKSQKQKKKQKNKKQQQQKKLQTQIWAKLKTFSAWVNQNYRIVRLHWKPSLLWSRMWILVCFLTTPCSEPYKFCACLMDWMCAFLQTLNVESLTSVWLSLETGLLRVIGFNEVIEWGLEPTGLVSL